VILSLHLLFVLACNAVGTVAVSYLNEELLFIQHEIKNGMLRPASYIIAKFILTVPFIIVFAICALGIPGWLMQNYPTTSPSWLAAVLLWSMLSFLFESLAECLAIWIDNAVVGMLLYLTFWVASFLFSGLFLPLVDLLWPLKIFYYATPFSYYIRSMYYVLYSDVTFDACDSSLNPLQPICVESGTGSDVLKALHDILPVFENKDNVAKDIGIISLMIVVFKVLYIGGVVLKGRKISIPKPSKPVIADASAGAVVDPAIVLLD